jgi:hypothetical protein
MSIDVREKNDRRRSQRWPCDKPIDWRVQGGRRVRHGMIPERSLDGLVIAASKQDAAPAGTRVSPSDDEAGTRLGFRCGVICRTAEVSDQYLLFIDILA